jgi:hypothetical protein
LPSRSECLSDGSSGSGAFGDGVWRRIKKMSNWEIE